MGRKHRLTEADGPTEVGLDDEAAARLVGSDLGAGRSGGKAAREALGDWRLGFVFVLTLFDIDGNEGICGRFGRIGV